tara:strand:+ start:467 stop:1729 length:1263 start_codon:yes stop_codon:yes gene_type:complete
MKAFAVEDFATLIGIDWADKKHDVCELITLSNEPLYSVISSKPEAIHQWANDLAVRYPNQQVAVACELQKGPLIYALSKYKHIVIFPLNPSSVAKYRKVFSPSGAKNDPKDAFIQMEMLRLFMDKLRALEPESCSVRALAQTVENRRNLVQDRVDITNKITSSLKNYFPQVIDWFTEKDTAIFCDFLTRWPSLKEAKKARKQTLITFFNQHNARNTKLNKTRINAIKDAALLTEDEGVVAPNKLYVEALVPQLKALNESIATFDKAIKQYYKPQSDKAIFDSFPGAGPQLSPRLFVAFGTNRERYNEASELQKYGGIAPVTEQSGKKQWVHWRYSCPTFLRQTFVEWAGQTVRYSFWARAYYEQQQAKGKPRNTIIRALAFKWIRIAFRCWQTHTPYSETKYLEALKRRDSPLLKFAVQK